MQFHYIIKIMTINDQIRDEKLQHDINKEAAKISALSSGKIHRYEYLTGEDIFTFNQQQIIEQEKFTYSPLGKLWKTNKNNWRSRKKTDQGFRRFETKRKNKSN